MLQSIDCWKKVIHNYALLEAIAQSDLEDVATMTILRKKWSVDEITIAAELTISRNKAVRKLSNAATLVSDSSGVQQSTSTAIAKHKAIRFEGQEHIIDLCCGIGSDLLALPNHAIGVDKDQLRCWMAHENTSKTIHCQDATTYKLRNDCVIHIDPSRRNSAGRIYELESMIPPFSSVCEITKNTAGGCIKLSPAINFDDIASLPIPFEIEYIEEKNRLVQAAVWYGSLTNNPHETTATSLGIHTSFSGNAEAPAFSTEIDTWILEPNVALERAGLHGTLGNQFEATELSPGIGLLSAKSNPHTPWFTPFEIIEVTSLRIEKVADILRKLQCTQVEVKTRGKTIDPNEWQNKLNKKSDGKLLTIFALRLGKKRVAIITRRCKAQ
jgi:hypothetical protein